MDLTQSFKKLYEAIPSIKCNSDRARYVDASPKDAGYFGSCGTGSYLVLPDTPSKRKDRWGEIEPYNKFFASIPDREVELVMEANVAKGKFEKDTFSFHMNIPCAYCMPTKDFMDKSKRFTTVAYTNHFLFSYLYLLHYGEKIVQKVQEYLMHDIDNPMDRMAKKDAEDIVMKRELEINRLFKKEFVEQYVVPYYETHQSAYDFDMHASKKEIYERVINDKESLEILGITRSVDKAKVIKKFGAEEDK